MIEREGPETIAAFIAEPVMGAGGVLIPPATYFEKVQAVLARHDIAFIADEVICGFARTGNWWGSQTFGIQPSTVTMAKAVTSAYVPMGALTVPEHVYETLVEASGKHGVFAHGFTYSGHPLACAVALKTIEIYERIKIVEHVRRVAPIFLLRLRALADHPLVGEARGVGLIGGLELVKDKRSKQSFDAKLGVGAKAARLAEEEGRAVPGRWRRHGRTVPAAHYRWGRDQRHVRLRHPRPRPHRELGAQGGASVAHARSHAFQSTCAPSPPGIARTGAQNTCSLAGTFALEDMPPA